MHWYDGGKKPAQFADWGLDPKKWDNGVVFVGEKGQLFADYTTHKLLPRKDFAGLQAARADHRQVDRPPRRVGRSRAARTTRPPRPAASTTAGR